MSNEANLEELICCPACKNDRVRAEKVQFICNACEKSFPIIGQIPWLFENAEHTLADWQNRFAFFLQVIETEVNSLKLALKKDMLLPETQKRLLQLIQAKIEQARQVEKLLKPLNLSNRGQIEHSIALSVKLPNTQALMSYYSNVCRDWVYGEKENRICLDIILEALGTDLTLGKCLTLGAGACRLPYDLHQAANADISVVVDINPYLFYAAKRLIDGKNLTIYEFPIAPLNLDAHAVKLKAAVPVGSKENFHFLFSDAMNPSFKSNMFDTILTPWLIDIIHQDNDDYFKRLNRILKPGARWINFGSLSYFHKDQTICYSLEEVKLLVENAGFTIEYFKQVEIPYLHSPYSAQKRQETVICFTAKKINDIDQPKAFKLMPEWLLDASLEVPLLADFQQQKAIHQTLQMVFANIDGKTSIRTLSDKLARELGLDRQHCEVMLTNLLAKFVEDKMQGRQF